MGQNHTQAAEIIELNKRAAVGFEELTPRYKKWKPRYRELDLRFPVVEGGNSKVTSDQWIEGIVEILHSKFEKVEKLKEVINEKKEKYKEIVEKVEKIDPSHPTLVLG